MLYWPSVVLVAAHEPTAAKLEEHTQLVVRSNTHGPVAEVVADRARPSNGDCGGDGMPTTAISTGSHCSGQARTKERDSGLLGRPTASE